MKDFEFQKIGFNEFNGIETEEECRNVIKCKNHKVAYADHIVAELACVSPEDICKSVKNKQNACSDLY